MGMQGKEPALSQESCGSSWEIHGFECNDRCAPAAGILIARAKAEHGGRPAQIGLDGGAQSAGALAMHHTDPPQPAPATLGEVAFEQAGDFRGAESVQVNFTRDGNRDGFIGIIRGHGGILGQQLYQAT